MSRSLLLCLTLAAGIALGLRLDQLDFRPMHTDEAVGAYKFQGLWEHGEYKYDPDEHHGPTLSYATLLLFKLTGAPDFIHLSETRYRLVTVLFGVGLILLLPLVADGLGRNATIFAALLTAISPAMVFYSRDFIHEMLLVFFTFLALACGWRYVRGGKLAWLLGAGASIGLMQSTKETFVMSLFAAGISLHVTQGTAFYRPISRQRMIHCALAMGMWLAVVVVLFSSFFTNSSGPLDTLRTYSPWLKRAGGASPHVHEWSFYLHRLLFFHVKGGRFWSEGLIFALAIAGTIAAFTGKGLGGAHAGFVRFIAVYTIVLTLIYCELAYKTPWCLIDFWHGAILLAGVGVVAVVSWMPRRSLKITAAAVLLAGAVQLAAQARRSSIDYCADRQNPYVYAQTSPDLLNLVAKVNELAGVFPQGHEMTIKAMAADDDYWPLPWYLREFPNTGWTNKVPSAPYAPVMIVSAKFDARLDDDKTHIMAGIFALRPEVFLELYVQKDLWQRWLDTRKKSADEQ